MGLGWFFCFFQIFIFYFCSGSFWGTEIPLWLLFCFSDVVLLEEILLLWVSMSLLRPLFTFLLSSSVIFYGIFFDVFLDFFPFSFVGFFPLLLSSVISSMLSHRDFFITYCVILYHRISVFFWSFSEVFIYYYSSAVSIVLFQYGSFFAIIWQTLVHWLLKFLSHAYFIIIDIVNEVFMDVNSIYTSHCFRTCLQKKEKLVTCWVLNSLHTSIVCFQVIYSQGGHYLFISLWGDFCLCHFLHSWSLPSTDRSLCLLFWSFLEYFVLFWLSFRA